MSAQPLIRFETVSFGYSADAAVLKDVSFEVNEGELVALLGENGSGKSTIAKLADVMLLPGSGTVRVGGLDTSDPTIAAEARRLVGFAFQDPDDQIVATLVKDDVAFGPSNLGLPREEVWDRVEEALRKLDLLDLASQDVNALSGGQKQRVALAGVLALRPKLLVLDEPTSMLDDLGRTQLLQLLQELKQGGIGILMVTHDMDTASQADRALLLDDGVIQEAPSLVELAQPLEEARISVREGRDRRMSPSSSEQLSSTLISIDRVSFAYQTESPSAVGQRPFALEDVSCEVLEGELLAITGSNGSGKSTLIRLMNGLAIPTEGKVSVFGQDTASKQGRNHARAHVGICFQYPERQFFAPTVHEDVAAGPKNQGLTSDEIDQRVQEALEAVGLEPAIVSSKNPFRISGGEQRRVAIAGFLAMHPSVLVLDEPCANLDLPSHAEMLRLIASLNEQGTTIVLVSHEEQDVRALARRTLRLECGKLVSS